MQWTLPEPDGGAECEVCAPLWRYARCLGCARQKSLVALVEAGHTMEPPPIARVPPQASKRQWSVADSWFLSLWKGLGDHMADTEDKATADPIMNMLASSVPSFDFEETGIVLSADHPLWENSALIPDPANPMVSHRRVPVKHLNPQKFEDIFLLHELQCGADAVSYATLRRCWNDRWSQFLKIRDIGQGKRCRECAELSEERSQATTPDAIAAVREKTQFHIDSVMADRSHAVRDNHIAERDAKVVSPDGHGLTIKMVIDGMDQAKWRCPRNLASSAAFESLWRPQLHVTGVIVHGILECYFILPPDTAKDSNMNATCINRALDLVREHQEMEGKAMPRTLIINSDNTTRESKNQFFLCSECILVAQDKFEVVHQEFLKTGHTHNELDQRFGTVATTLNRAPILETEDEFKDWLLNNVQPARGRKLHVELLTSTMNFKKWQVPLNMSVGGLAAHKGDPNTCHSWKLVQRHLLGSIDQDLVIENQHVDWEGMEPHPRDVILLLKESISSSRLSQRPLLVLPAVLTDQLSVKDLEVSAPVDLGTRALKEFRKTADAVEKPPWNLVLASNWLRRLCDNNEKPTLHMHSFKFLSEYTMPSLADAGSDSIMLNAPEPRQVFVGKPSPADIRSRLQSRPSPADVTKKRPAGDPGAFTQNTLKKRKVMKRPAGAAAASAADVVAADQALTDVDMAIGDLSISIEEQMQAALANLPGGGPAQAVEVTGPAAAALEMEYHLNLHHEAAAASAAAAAADATAAVEAAEAEVEQAMMDAGNAIPLPALGLPAVVVPPVGPGPVPLLPPPVVGPPMPPGPIEAPPRRRRTERPPLPVGTRYGCPRCRYGFGGCIGCRPWAATGHRGYFMGPDGSVRFTQS